MEQEIMAQRPLPISKSPWVMRQVWEDFLFMHWPVNIKEVAPHVPKELIIDTYNGKAWVSVVIFVMKRIYLRGVPFVSVVPAFPEFNVRTYVRYNDKPGIFLFSIDVDNLASTLIAKRWYRLPYYNADTIFYKQENTYYFSSKRKEDKNCVISGAYRPLTERLFAPQKLTIDHWLLERFYMYSSNKHNLYITEIQRPPWRIQLAEAKIRENTMFAPLNIDISAAAPIIHFAKGMETFMSNRKKISQ